MVPHGVTHDGIAQATWGLAGFSINNAVVSGLAAVTMGFLFGYWTSCYTALTTSWTGCSNTPATTWTEVSL